MALGFSGPGALLHISPVSPNPRLWRWGDGMKDFKGRHYKGEIILWAVRWYCKYGISYRDLESMLAERGVGVDHSTVYRCLEETTAL